MKSIKQWTGSVVVLALAAACGGAPRGDVTSALTQAQAISEGTAMMQALNAGDHQAYVQTFSQEMRQAVTPAVFEQVRAGVLQRSGRFEEVMGTELVPAKTAGYVTWVHSSKFEREQVDVRITYAENGTEVAGIRFDSPSYR
jgi:hypothetical protein